MTLSDLLPLDEADEAEFRQAARTFVVSTKEALPWLQSAFDTLRGTAFGGETSELFRGLPSLHAGWLGRPTVPGQATSGTGPAGRLEPGARAELPMFAEERLPDGVERNVVRELIRKARRVVDHPMTWFVVFLVMVAGLAVSAARRWFR